jgi:peptide/nickel transport system substrate-binding protein
VSSNPSELVLERFDRYYQGTPTVSRVVVRPVDTLRTAWTSLLRGAVDVVSDVPADAVEFIRNDDIQVIRYQRRYQWLLAFNSRRGALRSADVRRALNLAVDRQRIVDRVLRGNGTVSEGPLWPKYWAYDASVPAFQFDPRQARTVLDDAGFELLGSETSSAPPSRFRFTCLVPNFTVWERIALEIQKDLLNVGVDMQLRLVSLDEFNTRISAGDFDAIVVDMISGPTPARAYAFWRSRRAYPNGLYNVFGYENAEVERLFDVVNTSSNEAAIRSAMRRLQELLRNDPPALTIAWNTRARAVRREFVIPADSEPIASLWRWTLAPGPRPPSNRTVP